MNLASANVDEDISIISEKLTVAIKACYLFIFKSLSSYMISTIYVENVVYILDMHCLYPLWYFSCYY